MDEQEYPGSHDHDQIHIQGSGIKYPGSVTDFHC